MVQFGLFFANLCGYVYLHVKNSHVILLQHLKEIFTVNPS